MCAGPSSQSIAIPNKLRGVYSRPASGRVSHGERGAAWGIFPVARRIGGAIGVVRIGQLGAKVGREKSADACQTHVFPSFLAVDRLMGRWAGPVSAFGRAAPVAPLGVAALSGHPVAQGGPEIWKISARSAAINMFLPVAHAAKENLPLNGSGCGPCKRQFPVKRVGVRLSIAGKARVASMLGLSGPGLESATLGRGGEHVN